MSSQTQHPWRTTVRTVVQAVVGLCTASPLVYQAATQESPLLATGAAGTVLGVTGAVTRIMALPAVDRWLHAFVPWLASDLLER